MVPRLQAATLKPLGVQPGRGHRTSCSALVQNHLGGGAAGLSTKDDGMWQGAVYREGTTGITGIGISKTLDSAPHQSFKLVLKPSS